MNAIEYSEPVLCHYDYDLSKAWFVYFDVTNTLTGEVKRKQFRGGINYYLTKTKRLAQAGNLIAYWKDRLKRGDYDPFSVASISPVAVPESIKDAIEKVLIIKKAAIRERSKNKYQEVADTFVRWLQKHKYANLRLFNFEKHIAQAYLDHLVVDKKYSGKTHNNHMAVMHSLSALIVDRWPTILKVNPFTKIKRLPEDEGKIFAYSDAEAKALMAYFRDNDKRMYFAANFLVHCFIRKTELCHIRVGDIDWTNKTIRMNSLNTKNRRQDSVTISKSLLKVLYEMGLDLAPPHYYIFGKKMLTCKERCTRADDISERHLVLKTASQLPIDKNKAFYSWKHTGAVAYWKIVKDPYFMMRQLRHRDLKTTMIYLKSLGLMANEAFQSAEIEI